MRATANMKKNETLSLAKRPDPVKIYIDKYYPKAILSKINELDDYFKCTTNYTRLLSSSGIFQIENNKLYKLKPIDKPIVTIKKYCETCKGGEHLQDIELLVDASLQEKETIYSQIPYEHITSNIVSFHYSCQGLIDNHNNAKNIYNEGIDNTAQKKQRNKETKMTLVVEGEYDDRITPMNCSLSHTTPNKYSHFIPTNVYFLATEDIENYLIKQDIIEFLSVLI